MSRNALFSAASKFHSAAVMRSLSKRNQMLMRICAQPDSALWTNALPTFAPKALHHTCVSLQSSLALPEQLHKPPKIVRPGCCWLGRAGLLFAFDLLP